MSTVYYEQSIIGAVMLETSLMAELGQIITANDFTDTSMAAAWSAMSRKFTAGEQIDVVTVAEESGLLLADCADMARNATTTSPEIVCGWAQGLRGQTRVRRLRVGIQKAAQDISEPNANVDEVAAGMRDYLLSFDGSTENKKRDLKDMVRDRVDALRRRWDGEESVMGLSTGILDLDAMTYGLQNANFILLAARPGMGKSTVALKWAQENARKGKHVAMFSLEMSNDETIDRALVQMGRLKSQAFNEPQKMNLDPHDIEMLGPLINEIKESSLELFDDIFDIESITAKCRALHQKKKLDLVVIDYLQLISSRNSGRFGGNRTLEVGDYSRTLKMLSMSLNVPVVALSQLNRAVESRPDKRPMMADLRESGSLEQDANKIFMLYIDQVYNENTEDKGIAEIIVRKNRGGSTGTVKCSVDLSRYSFSDWAPDKHMQQAQAAGIESNPFA